MNNEARVLLITSRDTGRWIIPKGNIDRHLTPWAAAAREAFEEAGVEGVLASHVPLGFYPYFKRLRSGEPSAAMVEVYLMRVTDRWKQWPEKGERRLSWLLPGEAITVIQEPGAVPLLRRFAELLEWHSHAQRMGLDVNLQHPAVKPPVQTRPTFCTVFRHRCKVYCCHDLKVK